MSEEVLCAKWCKQSKGARHRLKTSKVFASLKAHILDFISLMPKIIKNYHTSEVVNWELVFISTVVCWDMAFQKCVLKFIPSLMNICCSEKCSIIYGCGTTKIVSCTDRLFTDKHNNGYSSLMHHEVLWFPSDQPQDRNQKTGQNSFMCKMWYT